MNESEYAPSLLTCFSPSWKSYFDSCRDLEFSVYEARQDKGPLYVFHHGGGHTALTWALTVSYLKQLGPCSILCYDARGHGTALAWML